MRKFLVKKRAQAFLAASESILLRTSKGVRLQVELALKNAQNKKLAILFHGWEGSADSSYIIQLAHELYQQGYCVARFNLRDHGDTHHLNQQPFNSVRLDEVVEGIQNLCKRISFSEINLCGFSLGGNFVLRLSAHPAIQSLPLKQTVSICPAIDPVITSDTIENGPAIYHQYFVKKWKRSIDLKYRYFPEIMRSSNDLKARSLNQMNAMFVPWHTDYDEPETYLSAYSIQQHTLDAIKTNCLVIYSDDDPIINAQDFDRLKSNEYVTIEAQTYGGHCAFINNWSMDNWAVNRIVRVLGRA